VDWVVIRVFQKPPVLNLKLDNLLSCIYVKSDGVEVRLFLARFQIEGSRVNEENGKKGEEEGGDDGDEDVGLRLRGLKSLVVGGDQRYQVTLLFLRDFPLSPASGAQDGILLMRPELRVMMWSKGLIGVRSPSSLSIRTLLPRTRPVLQRSSGRDGSGDGGGGGGRGGGRDRGVRFDRGRGRGGGGRDRRLGII